jgi:TonB family protein
MADEEKTGNTSQPSAGDKAPPTSKIDLDLLLAVDRQAPNRVKRVIVIAVAAHFLLPLFFLIESKEVVQEKKPVKKAVMKVLRIIHPPKIPPPPTKKEKKVRVIVPDPTPDEPEPIREPEPPEVIIPPGVPVIIGIPDGPPAPVGPLTVGLAGTTKPMRIHYIEPEYPEEAKRVGLEGHVILLVTVGERGSVVDVTLIQGGPLGMTESAVEAVWKWRYEPSTLHGKPISLSFTQIVRFTLE